MATKRLFFSTSIQAPPDRIWQVLWADATYRQWTSVFTEGSYAVSDWKEGSRIHFLSPGGSGLYSEVARAIPNELMSIRHLGVVKDGKELPADDETKSWAGAMENYRLIANGNSTRLEVELDTTEASEAFFNKTFPLALEEIKKLAETRL